MPAVLRSPKIGLMRCDSVCGAVTEKEGGSDMYGELTHRAGPQRINLEARCRAYNDMDRFTLSIINYSIRVEFELMFK